MKASVLIGYLKLLDANDEILMQEGEDDGVKDIDGFQMAAKKEGISYIVLNGKSFYHSIENAVDNMT